MIQILLSLSKHTEEKLKTKNQRYEKPKHTNTKTYFCQKKEKKTENAGLYKAVLKKIITARK